MNVVTVDGNGITRRVQPERMEKIQRRSNDILDQSKLLKIFDIDSFNQATLFLKAVKSIQEEIDSAFDPIIRAQHQAHKKSLETKRRYSFPLDKAEGIVKVKIREYHLKAERARQEEEARLQREAKKAEEERLIQLAMEADEAGENDEAQLILSSSVEAPVITVPSQTNGNGISYREVWKFRITNPDLVPGRYKIIDERKIGAVVRALKDKTNIPGIAVYCEKSVSVRRT